MNFLRRFRVYEWCYVGSKSALPKFIFHFLHFDFIPLHVPLACILYDLLPLFLSWFRKGLLLRIQFEGQGRNGGLEGGTVHVDSTTTIMELWGLDICMCLKWKGCAIVGQSGTMWVVYACGLIVSLALRMFRWNGWVPAYGCLHLIWIVHQIWEITRQSIYTTHMLTNNKQK